MCRYSAKLMAWLDRELEPAQMAQLKQHLRDCSECRLNIAKYQRATEIFDDYCDAAMNAVPYRERRRGLPALTAVAAILVLVAATAVLLRIRVQPLPPSPAGMVQPAQLPVVAETPTRPANVVRPRRSTPKAVQTPAGHWLPASAQPAVEVAIPADSMFPPGAVPEGISFVADVNFAADGSARQMRLRPRLTAVERSASQP